MRFLALQGSDTIDLFTDGLVEIACAAGCEPLKPRSLFERVEYGPDFHRRLMEAALAGACASDFTDDVTILTARLE